MSWGVCNDCGCRYEKTENSQRLCPICSDRHIEMAKERNRVRMRENYRRKKAGLPPLPPGEPIEGLTPLKPYRVEQKPQPEPKEVPDPDPNECRHTGSCIFGETGSHKKLCNYFTITGRLRTSDGLHQIVDGKCDLYKRKSKNPDKTGWRRWADNHNTNGGDGK